MEKTAPKFYIKHNELIPSDKPILDLLNPAYRYQELPSHFIAALTGRPYDAKLLNRLAQLAHLGHLRPFNPNGKTSKHYSYSLNSTGFNRNDRPHRILLDLVKASIEIGIKADSAFKLSDWEALLAFRNTRGEPMIPPSTLAILDKGKNPHKIRLEDGHVLPDGRPFQIHHMPTDKHLFVLGFEIDRATEPLTTTRERRNIEEKFAHYNEVFDKRNRLYTKHYGFDNSVMIWLTVSESRMHAMKRLLADKFGPASYHLFTHWKDWYYEVSFPQPDGTMFERPYERVGYPDFYLNRFTEM